MKKDQIYESLYLTNKYIVFLHVDNTDDVLEIISKQN